MLRLTLFLLPVIIWAERPGVGVRFAWPLNSSYCSETFGPNTDESAGRRATIGASLRVPVTSWLAVRAMPAWQRVSLDFTSLDPLSHFRSSTTANRWEIPVVVEWRVSEHVRPGIGAVGSFVSDDKVISKLVVAPGFGTPDGYTNLFPQDAEAKQRAPGAVVDIEFPFHSGFATIAPDVRYTRWFSKHFGRRGRLDSLTVGLTVRFGS